MISNEQMWRELPLSEIIHVNPKRDLRKGQKAKKVMMNNLRENYKSINNFQESVYKGGSKFTNDDTLVARITPCLENGKTAFVDFLYDGEVGFGSTEFIVVSAKNGFALPHFAYYLLRSPEIREQMIQSMTGTSGRQRVPNEVFDSITAPIPSIKAQESIQAILKCLDDKIELNRRMNATLEAMARAIFKSWFVDFDPVRAKMEGKEPAGMDVETAVLFPKKLMGFKEKLVPEGWELKTLGTFIELDKGLSYKGKFLVDGFGTPMVNLGTVAPYYGFLHNGLKHYSGEFKERHTVKPGSIIIANTDMTQNRVVLGSPAIVPDLKSDTVIFTHHIFAMRNNSSLPNTFIYYLLQNDEYRNRVKGFATGTTVLALPKEAVLDYEFPMPPKELVDGFCQIAYLVHKKIEQNNEESNTLAALRDTLLPKLISGEIRVPDAMLEAVET